MARETEEVHYGYRKLQFPAKLLYRNVGLSLPEASFVFSKEIELESRAAATILKLKQVLQSVRDALLNIAKKLTPYYFNSLKIYVFRSK